MQHCFATAKGSYRYDEHPVRTVLRYRSVIRYNYNAQRTERTVSDVIMRGFKSVGELMEHANEIIFSPGMQSGSERKNIRHTWRRGWADVVRRRGRGAEGRPARVLSPYRWPHCFRDEKSVKDF